jgi:hypothetical protein
MCWRKVPLHACTRPSILLPGPGVRKWNLCTWLGAGQLQVKKNARAFFPSIKKGCAALSIPCFHSTAVCLCFARGPHSTLQSLNCCVREHLLQVFVWKSISRSSVWKPKAISRYLWRPMRCWGHFESSGTSCCPEGKQNLFLFFTRQFFVFVSFSEASGILRSKSNLVFNWY